jgi:hypothetical protein
VTRERICRGDENKGSPVDQQLKALEFFKDWTNYLLITTVAALGWVSTQQAAFSTASLRHFCIWCLAVSIVFAIFTLALIPLVAEQVRTETKSIHSVKVKYYPIWVWLPFRTNLKVFCCPQHVFFLVGVVLYALGTTL